MRSRLSPSLDRSPDNELYDRGCDLVVAAAAIRRVAAAPHAARAVPAVLGCIEAAMHELAQATAGLEESTREAIMPGSHGCGPRSDRMRRGYANLEQALEDAERAAAAARPLTSRVLSRVGSARSRH